MAVRQIGFAVALVGICILAPNSASYPGTPPLPDPLNLNSGTEWIHAGLETPSLNEGTYGFLQIANNCPDREDLEWVYTWVSQNVRAENQDHWYQAGWSQDGVSNCSVGKIFWAHTILGSNDYDRDYLDIPEGHGSQSQGHFLIFIINDATAHLSPTPYLAVDAGFSVIDAFHGSKVPDLEPHCEVWIAFAPLAGSQASTYHKDSHPGECTLHRDAALIYEIAGTNGITNTASTADPYLLAERWKHLTVQGYAAPSAWVTYDDYPLADKVEYKGVFCNDKTPRTCLDVCPPYGGEAFTTGGKAGPDIGC